MPVPPRTEFPPPTMTPAPSPGATAVVPETAEKLFKTWPRRALKLDLDMGEASREQGFRLNGSR